MDNTKGKGGKVLINPWSGHEAYDHFGRGAVRKKGGCFFCTNILENESRCILNGIIITNLILFLYNVHTNQMTNESLLDDISIL